MSMTCECIERDGLVVQLCGAHGQVVVGIEETLAMKRWQPIETAPQDTLMLVSSVGGVGVHIAMLTFDHRYKAVVLADDNADVFDDGEVLYTHWMPLPYPPTA